MRENETGNDENPLLYQEGKSAEKWAGTDCCQSDIQRSQ